MQGVPREGGARDRALRWRRDSGRDREKEPARLGCGQLDAADSPTIEDLRHAALDDDKIRVRWRIRVNERDFFRPHAGRARDARPRFDERRLDDVRTADEVRDEPAQRPVVDLFRRSDLNDHD